MGNYRFRLSDMMPNAWFYKLRDMSKQTRNHHSKKKQPLTTTTTTSKTLSSRPKEQNQPLNPPRPRKSYYFTRDLNVVGKSLTSADKLLDPPRKSSKQRTRKRNSRCSPKRFTSSSSVSAGCSCRLDSVWTKSDSPPEYSSSPLDSSPELSIGEENAVPESFDGMVTWCSSCSCRVNSLSKPSDIVIEVDDKSFKTQLEKLQDNFDSISELQHLPPIITKPAGFNDMIDDIRKLNFSDKDSHKSLSVKVVKEQSISVQEHKTHTPVRKVSLNSSQGVKLRIHSPKIASRKIQAAGRRSVSSSTSSSWGSRRSLSDSCAVVKSSFDPQRDFRESMMEMIVENNLKASKDLEDLLACYLSLNSDEYHELIIKVFKQIWFDLNDIRFK